MCAYYCGIFLLNVALCSPSEDPTANALSILGASLCNQTCPCCSISYDISIRLGAQTESDGMAYVVSFCLIVCTTCNEAEDTEAHEREKKELSLLRWIGCSVFLSPHSRLAGRRHSRPTDDNRCGSDHSASTKDTDTGSLRSYLHASCKYIHVAHGERPGFRASCKQCMPPYQCRPN